MAGIKQLAGQTIWYGLSSIVARFINYLLTPFLTYSAVITTADFGKMGLIYSAIPILNVLFTYGFETAYFRFSNETKQQQNLYSTSLISLISTTILFSFLLFSFQSSIANLTGLASYPQMIQWAIAIIALDTICVLPFAKMRQEGRPAKFAFIKVAGIFINVFFTWFFVGYCPFHLQDFFINSWYNVNTNPIIYVLFANFLQALFTLVLLLPALIKIKWQFNWLLWKEMMVYALPLIIVGLGGIVNETFDRLMLRAWLPGLEEYKQEQVGIYNACYKLSILITLFIQAFKMGAEPFFLNQAQGLQPQKVYARVMKFFVLTILVMFLVVSMF
ncbi:MAG: lipopolysaccharide biosynthesis protein, partial [Chitinophagaceae bacterium]